MSISKDRGTRAETAVVRWLQANGWPSAERRALRGNADAGDITGTPGICWEIKGGTAARDAITATRSSNQITEWLAEAERERATDNASFGVLVVQTPGVTDPGRWWAVVTADVIAELYDIAPTVVSGVEVRIHLAGLAELLRRAGWGKEPISS